MDSAKLNDWMQVIGIFALVASLIFVGYQLKQDREIAMAATYQERTSATTAVLSAYAGNPAALSALIKTTTTFEPGSPSPYLAQQLGLDVERNLTPLEAYAGVFLTLSIWQLWDNSHFQYSQGFLPEDHWSRIRDDIKRNLQSTPMYRLTYERQGAATSRAAFSELIGEIIAELDEEVAPDQD
jgi:hypothetical protein